MRCFDRAKIYVKAGDRRSGVVAFQRKKFVSMGGLSGGDGGRGRNVYVEADGSMNSLLSFRNKVHFRAGRGLHGQGMMMNGAKGEDVIMKVALGTVVREADREEVLLELLWPGQHAFGNAVFKCGNNKVPKIVKNDEEGPEIIVNLELVEKPFVIAFNKMDLPEAYENWPSFKKSLQALGIELYCMSSFNI